MTAGAGVAFVLSGLFGPLPIVSTFASWIHACITYVHSIKELQQLGIGSASVKNSHALMEVLLLSIWKVMNVKQHVPDHPCVLLWVRGDTTHVTEDSVGKTVLSWSDTYFAQVVPLHAAPSCPSGFRPKECKFKVQQRGKTLAKTALVDMTKYCSDTGQAREQTVSLPLQPSGTLYFVISTAPASEQQQQQHQQQQHLNEDRPSSQSFLKNLMRVSLSPGVGGGGGGGGSAMATSVTGGSDGGCGAGGGGSPALFPDSGGRQGHNQVQDAVNCAAKYGGAAAGAVSALAAAVAPTVSSGQVRAWGATPVPDTVASTPDGDGDRPSTSGRGQHHQRKPSGGPAGTWVGGLAAAAAASGGKTPSPQQDLGADGGYEKSHGLGVFKRKTGTGGGGSANKPGTTAFAAASGAAAAATAAVTSAIVPRRNGGGGGSTPAAAAAAALHSRLSSLRKSDSESIIPQAAAVTIDLRASWDEQAERSLSQAVLTAGGGAGAGRRVRASGSGYASAVVAASQRAIHSFTGTTPVAGGRGPGPMSSPLNVQLPPAVLDSVRNLARPSGAASTCSDIVASAGKGGGGGGGAAVGGGGGWGTWLRSGLGWGRSSNHSVARTSTGAISQVSLANGGAAAAGEYGGGGAGGEMSALEAAIMGATEAVELRELALDLLHEREEWRSRALAAQDALGRAQTARGSALREAQRLELRLRQYQDELGRRTDGSLLQELVEAKVRIADLANENMKLRRQITHMGPLFYDDSGDDDGRA
ncbi:hypothetical protein VOLCADRAFT_93892 [Volvox carteri f. nagariensis]|uniref:C2 NT-type domain-containing protein n=1 Tax=Volvox carteri f. nagariensis TaxID=3068 RepID=D8U3C4_VOLCA|nr:uncharacterized protein VOLCADRAFT_93892 [Volvox carteri f. nagariensis]EFJ45728.1 hypothetical protein VOLCADRAFT_93892 [Volvox carteri f. nagariensis]|eukprot:XP_002953129.1 hypothetical protein VOLCADRAFT_93892 [Volvox carteri f. nagariensis]